MIELIATSTSKGGGICVHCHHKIPPGAGIAKFTRCCDDHEPSKRGKNGPGVWVCRNCKLTLLADQLHDGIS